MTHQLSQEHDVWVTADNLYLSYMRVKATQ